MLVWKQKRHWQTPAVPWHNLVILLNMKPILHSQRYEPTKLEQPWSPHTLPARHSSISVTTGENVSTVQDINVRLWFIVAGTFLVTVYLHNACRPHSDDSLGRRWLCSCDTCRSPVCWHTSGQAGRDWYGPRTHLYLIRNDTNSPLGVLPGFLKH